MRARPLSSPQTLEHLHPQIYKIYTCNIYTDYYNTRRARCHLRNGRHERSSLCVPHTLVVRPLIPSIQRNHSQTNRMDTRATKPKYRLQQQTKQSCALARFAFKLCLCIICQQLLFRCLTPKTTTASPHIKDITSS